MWTWLMAADGTRMKHVNASDRTSRNESSQAASDDLDFR
jgi:hypothetical protein